MNTGKKAKIPKYVNYTSEEIEVTHYKCDGCGGEYLDINLSRNLYCPDCGANRKNERLKSFSINILRDKGDEV